MADDEATTTEAEAPAEATETDAPVAEAEAPAEDAPAAPARASELSVLDGHVPAPQPLHYPPAPTAPVKETFLATDKVTEPGDPDAAAVKFLGVESVTAGPLTLAGADGELRTAEDVFGN